MDSIIERVARAITTDSAYDQLSKDDQDYWLNVARTAITAMREPTNKMMKQATETAYPLSPVRLQLVWKTMIDEALRPLQ